MLLEITLTRPAADDLGYLLGKHPDRLQHFELPFGTAHVYFPERSATRCTAALQIDVDSVGLVRGARHDFALAQYVNDRPYMASSFLSVAIARIYRSALAGLCAERPTDAPLPLQARIAAVPCRDEDVLRKLFAPLGYDVAIERPSTLDITTSSDSPPAALLTLRGTVRLQELLSHLYVLLPALDGDKHYWIGDDEVDKLLKHGDRWLSAHPARAWIATRYLKRRRSLVDAAMERLRGQQDDPEPDPDPEMERKLSLNDQRIGTVLATLRGLGARRVVDLGCGEGRLIRALLDEPQFEEIVGVDVSYPALQKAEERLERLPQRVRARATLLQGSVAYRDRRLENFDAITLIEVIEHLDPPRLRSVEPVVFGCARPRAVIVTTPNLEFNARFEGLVAGALRHRDHRFEWTRAEFAGWARDLAARQGYGVRFLAVGESDEALGAPTQMAIFERSQNAD